MPFPDSSSEGNSPFRPPFQYSLWSLFVLMTAAALGLAFLVGAPTWLMLLVSVLLALALPMVLTIAVIYGRGRLRTFSIGALFPAGVLVLNLVPMLRFPFYGMFDFGPSGDDVEARVILAAGVVLAGALVAAFGLLALWVRWIVERPGWQSSTGSIRPTEPQADMRPPPAPSEGPD